MPPTYEFESLAEMSGAQKIFGVDEAGRGALMSSVVAVAVHIPIENRTLFIGKVRDSKKLSKKQREELFSLILNNTIWSLGVVDNETIDKINILNAAKLAVRRALAKVSSADYAIIDGNMSFDKLSIPYKSIIKGDDLSISISCASILAKVFRDCLVEAQALDYPKYLFEQHHGYGTEAHREAIKKYGPCSLHRKTFGGVKEYV